MTTSYELNNIRTYKIYSIFNNLLILGPIITLFYLAKGLSFFEIFLLTSVASVTTVIFEVPTGAVSDRFSRKFSLVIGSILCGISLLVFVYAPNFIYMVIAEVIFSIGITFRSGTEQAILYDSLKNNDLVHRYAQIEGKARSYAFYAQAVGSLLAGFLFEINMSLPFFISVIFMFIAAIIACFFVEPLINKKTISENYISQVKESFKFTFSNKKVFSIILFSVTFMLFYRVGFNYFQPYMQSVGIKTRYFGLIFFFFNIVAGYASKHTQEFINLTKPRSMMALCLLLVVSFIMLGFIKLPIGIIFLFLQQFARGYRMPVFQKYINKHIPSDKRATILSIQSFSHAIVIAVCAPLFGLLLDKTDIYLSHLVIGVSMLSLVLLANRFMKNTIVSSIDRDTKVS